MSRPEPARAGGSDQLVMRTRMGTLLNFFLIFESIPLLSWLFGPLGKQVIG